MENKQKALERQYVSIDDLSLIEQTMIHQEHVRRYASIRRFCYGKVLDLACGCGYGSFLIAGNPDVTAVTGADIDTSAIEWAQKEFKKQNPKLHFVQTDSTKIKGKYDTLVCIETIEHIKDTSVIPTLVEKCDIDNIIVSFPDKKTTHYNKHHFHDFLRQDIVRLFPNHIPYHTIRFMDSYTVLMVRLPKNAPGDIFRNTLDLHQ